MDDRVSVGWQDGYAAALRDVGVVESAESALERARQAWLGGEKEAALEPDALRREMFAIIDGWVKEPEGTG